MKMTSRSDLGFFELGCLLQDNSKTLDFLQDSVIPNSTRKDCIFCKNEKCVVLRKTLKQIIPYTLRC